MWKKKLQINAQGQDNTMNETNNDLQNITQKTQD